MNSAAPSLLDAKAMLKQLQTALPDLMKEVWGEALQLWFRRGIHTS